MKPKIYFRADGGPTIGMGHFIRTLALAEMLNEDFYCIYATQAPTIYQIHEIESVCLQRIDLPANDTHYDCFLNCLRGDEIVVLDNYYFSTDYQRAIKAKGCKLVCIDDIYDRHFVADVIINQADGVKSSQYSAESYTEFCLGFNYSLLRKNYLLSDSDNITKQYACLVMMGGIDSFNLTAKIISIIDTLNYALPIAVVVGPDYPNEDILNQFNNIKLFKGIQSSKVMQLMQESYWGVFPASTVAIESCAARLPFICGYFVENQMEVYHGIQKNNLAVCIGSFLHFDPSSFINAIEKMNQRDVVEVMIQKQRLMLDKRSKERFIKIFQHIWSS